MAGHGCRRLQKQPVKETKATDFRSACYLLFSRKHFCFAALWLLFAKYIRPQTCKNRQHGDTCDHMLPGADGRIISPSVPNCPPRIVSTARTRRSSITGKVRIGQSTSRNFARTSVCDLPQNCDGCRRQNQHPYFLFRQKETLCHFSKQTK